MLLLQPPIIRYFRLILFFQYFNCETNTLLICLCVLFQLCPKEKYLDVEWLGQMVSTLLRLFIRIENKLPYRKINL